MGAGSAAGGARPRAAVAATKPRNGFVEFKMAPPSEAKRRAGVRILESGPALTGPDNAPPAALFRIARFP